MSPHRYEFLSQWKWNALVGRNTIYAWRSQMYPGGTRKFHYMHRVILGDPEGLHVDHIDRDGLHNWDENLRAATPAQNAANSRSRGSSSGFKGVFSYGNGTRYRAMIAIGGKIIHLGCRDSAEETARLYDAAARRHYGEFASCNFPVQP